MENARVVANWQVFLSQYSTGPLIEDYAVESAHIINWEEATMSSNGPYRETEAQRLTFEILKDGKELFDGIDVKETEVSH